MKNNTAGDDLRTNCSVVDGNITMVGNTALGDDLQARANTVDGNVTLKNNTAADNIDTMGIDFTADPVRGSISGNLIVKENSAGRGLFVCCDAFIGGNVTVNSNEAVGDIFLGSGSDPDSGGMAVEGNVIAAKNSAGGSIFIREITVDGHLKCRGNEPDPTVSGNSAGGKDSCTD